MNRDELLTKLAMELAEWPKPECVPAPTLPGLWAFRHAWQCRAIGYGEAIFDGGVIFEPDWLQRRAELINKPSWDDAPEWAEWLAQDAPGAWFWFQDKPYVSDDEKWDDPHSGRVRHASSGLPVSAHDWRQTLEPRPITTSLGATPMTEEEQEMPAEERHDCDRCGGSWWSPHNAGCPCQASRSDGSTASYYELPGGATELQDLISYRNLNAQDGEIFRAIYRKGRASHSDALRDAKKVLFYAEAEVRRLEKYGK